MKVVTTPEELMDRGAWIRACKLLGLNEWAVNEGMMDSDHEITLTDAQARELGLLPRQDDDSGL